MYLYITLQCYTIFIVYYYIFLLYVQNVILLIKHTLEQILSDLLSPADFFLCVLLHLFGVV